MIEARTIRVYIACPFTANKTEGVERSANAAAKLLAAGFAVFVPNLNFFIEPRLLLDEEYSVMHHRAVEFGDFDDLYEFWLSNDYAFLDVCHVLLRLTGYSPGAVQEDFRHSIFNGKPVYYDEDELVALGPEHFYEDSQV